MAQGKSLAVVAPTARNHQTLSGGDLREDRGGESREQARRVKKNSRVEKEMKGPFSWAFLNGDVRKRTEGKKGGLSDWKRRKKNK